MSTARAEKAAVVAEVRDKLAASNSVIVSEYRGLTVGALAKLRRTLRPLGAEYKVYKNSLVKIAARDGAMAPVEPMVGGPVAITFVTGEVSAVAKAMREFARENEALKLKGAVVDGKAVDVKGLRALADLPSREVMLAKLAGLLKAPMANTAYMLSALPRKAAYGLKALVEQKQAA
ncbi:MAG: 50S ribosomal protein L10 [Actinomycetota bacterium]|jgi:large subunit ribosomal protein L10